jgi:hypothetical protein
VFTALTSAAGLAAYFATFGLHQRRQTEETIKEIENVTANLLRVVGWLFTLLLSITFTNVLGERNATEKAIESEARAISNVHYSLQRFGVEETRGIQTILVEFTQAVIDDDWPALAHGRLSERSAALLRQLEDGVLDLEASNARQKTMRPILIADVDLISDHRLSLLQQAGERPTRILIVVFFGYLISMVYFGVYRPRPIVVGLVTLYTMLVGVALYLVLAGSEPFDHASTVSSAPLELLLEVMRADMGDPSR